MGKGLVLVGIGTVIGLAMGVAVERLMNSMLFNAGGVDVVAYLIVVPSMLLVTDAGGLRARAPRLPDRADAGAALRVARAAPAGCQRSCIPHRSVERARPHPSIYGSGHGPQRSAGPVGGLRCNTSC